METPTEQADSSSEQDYVFSVNKINSVSCPKELETSVTMNDSAEIKMMIDTRAFFEQFGQKNFEKPEAGKEQGMHFAYGSNTPIPLLGKVTTDSPRYKQIQKITVATFYIVKEKHTSLMSFQTASEVELITVNTGKSANAVSTKNDETTPHQQEILTKRNKVFQGQGKLISKQRYTLINQ